MKISFDSLCVLAFVCVVTVLSAPAKKNSGKFAYSLISQIFYINVIFQTEYLCYHESTIFMTRNYCVVLFVFIIDLFERYIEIVFM